MLTNMIQVLRIFNPVIAAVLLAFNYISILKNMELRNQHAEVANMVNRLQEDVLHLSKSVLKVQHSSEKIDVITHLTEKTPEVVYNIAFYGGIIILFAVMGAAAYNAFSTAKVIDSTAKVIDSIEKSNALNKDLSQELLDRVSQLSQANISNTDNQSEKILSKAEEIFSKVSEVQTYLIDEIEGTKLDMVNTAVQGLIDSASPSALEAAQKAATVAVEAATVAGTMT